MIDRLVLAPTGVDFLDPEVVCGACFRRQEVILCQEIDSRVVCPRPWIDVFALPEKLNMAVTESNLDPNVKKVFITL